MFMAVGCAKDDANGSRTDISNKIEDANFRKYCISNFDLNRDGKISKDEAAMVETINIASDINIYSIKGVETFTNLKNLSVENQKLESVDISDLNLSYFSFKGCTSLKSINLNGNTASIGNCAFDGCTNLKDVVIPEAVTIIGYRAFCECVNIKNICITNNVKMIEDSAFYGCTDLTTIAIPDSTTSLGDYVFADCPNLSNITLGNGVSNIGHSAFAGCSSLTNITIPSSVVNIESAAFSECNFTNIEIPEGIKSIGSRVFAHCNKLISVTIGSGVEEIGTETFRNCRNLTNIYCKPTTPPSLKLDVFKNISSTAMIYVPMASVDAYKSATNWCNYADMIVGYDFN